MAKKRNKNKNKNKNNSERQPGPSQQGAAPPPPPAGRAPTSPPKPPAPAPSLEMALERLIDATRAAGIDIPLSPEPSALHKLIKREANADLPGLIGLVQAYRERVNRLEAQEVAALKEMEKAEAERRQLSAERQALASEHEALVQREKATSDERAALRAERVALDADQRALLKLRAELAERDEALTAREQDADAGFVSRREESLAELNKTHQALMTRCQTLAKQLDEARQAHVEDLLKRETEHRERLATREAQLADDMATRREHLEAEHQTRNQDLQQAQAALDVQQRELAVAARRLARDQADLKALSDDLEAVANARAQARVKQAQDELERTKALNTPLTERIAALEQELAQKRAAELALGHEPPEVVRRRLIDYEAEILRLRNELANRPSAFEVDELRRLREAREGLAQERDELSHELARAKSQLASLSLAAGEAEALRDANRAAEANMKLLQAAIDTLQSDVDERLNAGRDQPTFPELLRMDEDKELSTPTPAFYRPKPGQLDLKTFAQTLRNKLREAREEGEPELFYAERDIRAFVGGLAMSRLHLLQGISGIGKSSLPRRFAEAVGGKCLTVTVQAGWTDKADLLGYYNAFEGRYYESAFIKALYLAQTPLYKDRIIVVLLDEMNLSHPEQYGADILDVLERSKQSERAFELMSHRPSGKLPAAMAHGPSLPLPDNVWFVGTANHDETTKDFADKTYDRSFVLELPSLPERFPGEYSRHTNPISRTMLQEAFEIAANSHASDAEEAMSWLSKHLKAPLAERFKIGWGGRLSSQMNRFVPVVVAAGGSWHEALDQAVSSRILRRIRGRHDLMLEDVEALIAIFQSQWAGSTPPERSLTLLTNERRRLGGG